MGWGLGLCRDRKVDPRRKRVHLMRTGGYVHHVLPLDAFTAEKRPSPDVEGKPVETFRSTDDPRYQAMLAIIREGRRTALLTPRVDMPGAEIQPGRCRQFVPPPVPEELPALKARVDTESFVHLSWERSARTIGLSVEVHRSADADFPPGLDTLLATTTTFQHRDVEARPGLQHYALVLCSGSERSAPIRAAVDVPLRRPQKPLR